MKTYVAVLTAALCVGATTMFAAEPIGRALPCGKEGVAGGLGAGVDLIRHTVDVDRFPRAVCNDGTPAIFYYAPSTTAESRNRWIIFLQGGGACIDGQSCAERWCSVDSNYGLDKMSTSLSKPQIRGNGFLDPGPQNAFGTWNRVLVYYCSSDTWSGDTVRTLQASAGAAGTREYEIQFRGRKIVDAVLDTLRNAAPAPPRRRAASPSNGTSAPAISSADTPWPDLDEAAFVLFAGSSAGGAGVRANLDHVADRLRTTNPNVQVRGVIDAIYATLAEKRDFTKTLYCANDPAHGCDYATFTQQRRDRVDLGLYNGAGDESCIDWHTKNAPGTEWRCGDGEHVNLHHLTTPFFIRQDSLDTSIGGNFVEAPFGTPADYAIAVTSELGALPVPEEPRAVAPGLFVPQCTDHESFTDDQRVFDVRINGVNWHDTLVNWLAGREPQKQIRTFTGTVGRAPECP